MISLAGLLIFFATVVGGVRSANASPTQWEIEDGGNGHYYEAVYLADGVSWDDAKVAAANTTYLGNTGYLATVTASAEKTFVADIMVGIAYTFWIGGYQPSGSEEPDGGWSWVTGEPWNYSNWRSGEPNNNGDENAIEMEASDHPLGWGGTWNDVRSDVPYGNGYVVEYAPEPATLSLLALGGAALLHRKKVSEGKR